MVKDSPAAPVHVGLLLKHEGDSTDNPADELAARGLRVHDTPYVVNRHHTLHARYAMSGSTATSANTAPNEWHGTFLKSN